MQYAAPIDFHKVRERTSVGRIQDASNRKTMVIHHRLALYVY